jgi:hypothetical protein
LTQAQHAQRHRVRIILQGNALPNKHAVDASHLCEAAETGCSYFITHDRRILRKRSELHEAVPPSLTIVTLEEFFVDLAHVAWLNASVRGLSLLGIRFAS